MRMMLVSNNVCACMTGNQCPKSSSTPGADEAGALLVTLKLLAIFTTLQPVESVEPSPVEEV